MTATWRQLLSHVRSVRSCRNYHPVAALRTNLRRQNVLGVEIATERYNSVRVRQVLAAIRNNLRRQNGRVTVGWDKTLRFVVLFTERNAVVSTKSRNK